MSRTRTFIAVDLGKAIRNRTVSLQASLTEAGTEIKWVEPENLHVTLLFLGEVDNREIHDVCRVIAEEAQKHPAFTMAVESAGCFPNLRRPRVIWVGVGEGAQPLIAIHDALETALLGLGYRREVRRYTPHITLGRVKSDCPTEKLTSALARHEDWKGGETPVSELLIMGSELTPRGPVYTVLGRAELA